MAHGDLYIEERALSMVRDGLPVHEAIARARGEWEQLEQHRQVIREAMAEIQTLNREENTR